MRQTVRQFLEKPTASLTKGDRTALESLLAITANSDAVSATSEALREEIERRQGQPLTPESYRQRMKRLAGTLEKAKAPFRLVSSQRMVTAQPTFESDKDAKTGAFLSVHSHENTVISTANTVSPKAQPELPQVMFSYAHLEGAAHTAQLEFFNTLNSALRYPPEPYKALKIKLWRDEPDIRKAREPGRSQMDAACRESFLGLLLLSNKYPHSEPCMREADCFLRKDGENQPGKTCLIVPVNIGWTDAPERFRRGTRIWATAKGKNLLELWAKGDEAEKHAFVREVAEEIWQVAMDLPRRAALEDSEPTRPNGAHQEIESFTHCRSYEHCCGNKVPLFVREGQLGRSPSDAVPSAPQTETGRIEIVPHLADWAACAEGPRLVALLGDFGMGKTVACQLLTQKLLEQRKDDPSAPLPVYLDLRNIDQPETAGSTPLDDLIDQMLRRAGERPPAAAEVISYVRERGALIIFDGLDEVTNKLTTDQAIRLYRELLSIIPAETWRADATRKSDGTTTRGPRILVSCRTHYFRDLAAQRAFLIGHDRGRLSPDDDIKIYYLQPFDEEQIATYLGFHLEAPEVERALALIKATYNLQELAARPIFLTFIRQTLDRIEQDKRAGRTINIARLYDIFVEQSLERDNPKHIVPVREKRQLLADLALALHKKRRDTLSNDALDDWFDAAAQALPKLRRALEGGEGVSNAGRFLQDLRNASFLVRPGEEEFRFAHTSVREYFLANAIHKAICEGRPDMIDIPAISSETIGFILARQVVADDEAQDAFLKAFPSSMTAGNPTNLRNLAFAIWLASDAKLPRPAEMDLSGLDFSRRVFRGTDARPLPLSRTLWNGTKLRQTEFDRVDLEGAEFTGGIAPMSRWLGCRMSGTKWPDTDLTGSRWRDCQLDGKALAGNHSAVREAIRCRIGGKDWQPRKAAVAERWRAVLDGPGRVRSVALGRVGTRDIIVSGGDNSVRVWDALSGESLSVLEGDSGGVSSVALGRVGTRDIIVSGGGDGSVRVWDALSGESLSVLEGHSGGVSSVALGRVGTRDVIVSGGWDRNVRVWDAASGESLTVLDGHSGGVLSVALGRVGTRDVIVSGGLDNAVRVWDAASGESLAVLDGPGRVQFVALGRLGIREVVVSGTYNGVHVWDAVSGESLAVLESHLGRVLAVALGRVGTRDVIVSGGGDNSVRIWDALGGESLAMLEGHSGGVLSVALGRVGTRDVIVSGDGDNSVRVWDAASGESLAVLGGHSGGVLAVALGRVGTRDVIVSGGGDNSVRVWDAASGERLAVLEGHSGRVQSVALGRAGTRNIIVSGADDNSVRIWDAASGESLAVLKGQGPVQSVALGRLGTRDVIVSGGYEGSVGVRDALSGESLAVLEGHSGGVLSVALGRVGTRDVIVSGDGDNSVRVWDAASGESLAVLGGHSGGVLAVALGRVGTRDVIVSGGGDNSVRVWDAASGERLAVLEGHSGRVQSVALGRAGTRNIIVSGADDNSVRIWDAASGESLAMLEGLSGGVLSVALGRVGTRDVIVSGGDDGTLRIWDAEEALAASPGMLLRQLILGPGQNTLLDLVPDGAGGYRITRASPDVWRYFFAQGHTPDGRLITAPIETMMEPHANGK